VVDLGGTLSDGREGTEVGWSEGGLGGHGAGCWWVSSG